MKNVIRAVTATTILVVGIAHAEIEPSSEAEPPTILTYIELELSGLKSNSPFPTSNDVCLSLQPNALTKPFEVEGHFLIACPKHELGAIEDRKSLQNATVVGNAEHWVVLRVPVG